MAKDRAYPKGLPYHYNASNEPCDMLVGPCCCGAWHSEDEDWVKEILKAEKRLVEEFPVLLADLAYKYIEEQDGKWAKNSELARRFDTDSKTVFEALWPDQRFCGMSSGALPGYDDIDWWTRSKVEELQEQEKRPEPAVKSRPIWADDMKKAQFPKEYNGQWGTYSRALQAERAMEKVGGVPKQAAKQVLPGVCPECTGKGTIVTQGVIYQCTAKGCEGGYVVPIEGGKS